MAGVKMMSNMHPGIVLLAAAFIAVLLPQILRRAMLIVGPLAALFAFFQLQPGTDMDFQFSSSYAFHYFHADELSMLFAFGFCILALISGIFTFHNGNRMLNMCILATAGSALGVVFANDWVSVIFFWELMVVASAFLIWCRKTSSSRKAGLRYLILHMVAANLLLEAVFVNVHEGHTMLGQITAVGGELYWLVFLFLAIGAALFPMHAWTADCCSESTLTGSVALSAYLPLSAVYCMLRVFQGQEILILFGAVTAVYAAVRALISDDVRRILGYALSAQLGIIAALIGIGGELAVNAAAFLALTAVFGNAALFMSCVVIIRALGGEFRLSQMGNLFKEQPFAGVCFIIGGLTVSGMPFLAGFAGHAWGMEAISAYGSSWLEAALVIAQVGIFAAVALRAFWFMFYSENRGAKVCDVVPGNVHVPMILAAAFCIIIGIYSGPFANMLPYKLGSAVYSFANFLPAIEILAASSVVFVLMRRFLLPQKGLILDTDWFYRSAFDILLLDASYLFCALSSALGSAWNMLYIKFMELTANPMEFLDARPFRNRKRYDPENYRTSIADPIMITLAVLTSAICYFIAVI